MEVTFLDPMKRGLKVTLYRVHYEKLGHPHSSYIP